MAGRVFTHELSAIELEYDLLDLVPDLAPIAVPFVRQRETAWLDEAVPALGDRTPRECAAEPNRRPDVIALLDSFPSGPGGMDVERLRAALGLTGG